MNFILWTLVWWGIEEIGLWRIYKYRGVEYMDKNPGTLFVMMVIYWVLYIYLYKHFIVPLN